MSAPRRPMPNREPQTAVVPSVTPTVAPSAPRQKSPGVREIWANRQRRTPTPVPTGRRWLDTTTWVGALVVMIGVVAVLWIVQLVNSTLDYRLDRFGLRPRELGGLWGVVTEPFLHADLDHILSNTLPVLFVGWVLLLAGMRTWATVTVFVVLVGGLLTWVIGPSNTVIVGASGVVFGWLGYLVARAIFSRELKWILVGAAVLFFFGTLLFQITPGLKSNVSWQAHLCGLAAGIGIAALLHPRRGQTRFLGRTAVS